MATLAFRIEKDSVRWNAERKVIEMRVSFRFTDGTIEKVKDENGQDTTEDMVHNLDTPLKKVESIRKYLEDTALDAEKRHRANKQSEPEIVNILEQYENKVIDVRNQPPPEEE